MESPIVQIFPMNKGYLAPGQTVEDFFQNDLLIVSGHRPVAGRFNFKNSGVSAAIGSLLLFQYRQEIRAHGELCGTGKPDTYSSPDSRGYLLLEPTSVRFYEKPVSLAELQRLWPNVASLNRVKWRLDPAQRSAYENFVRSR